MGRKWNEQPCRCRKCNDEFNGIVAGKAHVWIKHKIPFYKAREQLVRI